MNKFEVAVVAAAAALLPQSILYTLAIIYYQSIVRKNCKKKDH